MYTVWNVTEICLLRNAVDVQSLLLGTYTVQSVMEICLLMGNAVDVQHLANFEDPDEMLHYVAYRQCGRFVKV